MSELDDAIEKARRELAETKKALEAARGSRQEELAETLASTQAEKLTLEKQVDALQREVDELRADCELRRTALQE